VWSTNVPVGVALMIVVSPLLLESSGWRGLWQVTAFVTAIWMVVLAAGTRREGSTGQRQAPDGALARNVRLTVSKFGTWLLALCFGLFTFQWLAVMVWLPTFLIEERGMGSAAAAVMTAVVVAVNVLGNLIAGWLLHRRFPRWLLMAGSAAAMGFAAVGIFDPDLSDGARYALCLAFSAVGGMPPTALRAAVPSFAPTPAQMGTTNGLLVQGLNLGNVAGPPALAAVVTVAGNWESAVELMIAAAVAMTILSLGIGAIEHRQRKTASEPSR
jgi:cyanate permease